MLSNKKKFKYSHRPIWFGIDNKRPESPIFKHIHIIGTSAIA